MKDGQKKKKNQPSLLCAVSLSYRVTVQNQNLEAMTNFEAQRICTVCSLTAVYGKSHENFSPLSGPIVPGVSKTKKIRWMVWSITRSIGNV